MKFYLNLSIFIFSIFSSVYSEVKVYSTVSSDKITVDETLNFSVVAEGTQDFPHFDMGTIKNFTVIAGPAQNSSFQWINGQVSSSKSLTWTLIPNGIGTFELSGLSAMVDGKKFALNSIQITVVESGKIPSQRPLPQGGPPPSRKGSQPSGDRSNAVILQAEPDKETAFQGEQITVYFKLYTRVNIHRYEIEKKPKGAGFWQEELYVPTQLSLQESVLNGVPYKVASLYKIALFPTKSGELTLEPMVLRCVAEVPASRTRFSPFFDDFFSDNFFTRTQEVIVKSPLVRIHVKPTPDPGRPKNYVGAVGEFVLKSSLDTLTAEVNQAVSYTVELKGTGNLTLFEIEKPQFPRGLEVFDPKVTFERDAFRDELSGARRWEYGVIPRQQGGFQIPGLELTYLNPTTGKWEKTSAKDSYLTVLPDKGLIPSDQGQGFTKEEIALLGQDIRYIRTKPIHFKRAEDRLIPSSFIGFNILAVILFVSPSIARRASDFYRTDKKKLRVRHALQNAKKSLKDSKQDDDFGRISEAIFRFIGDHFDVTPTGLDVMSVRELLRNRVDEVLIEEVARILEICDQNRFSPKTTHLSPNGELKKTVIHLLEKLDRKLK